VTDSKTWMCLICGWIYDEAAGSPEHGIAPGTPWEQVPMNWTCPECGARKEDFEVVQIEPRKRGVGTTEESRTSSSNKMRRGVK
jgi:rubredoxin